ncbi:MAG: hypothetical protein DRJ15_17705, partial [Bacteroidetes bacterium]
GAAYDLDFRNDTEAWAPLGASQKLLYSMDAGSSWTRIPSPESISIFDMIFPDSLHGYAVGYNGAFLKYKPAPVSVSEFESMDIGMKIYPNPAHQQITVQIRIRNGDGEKWRQGELVLYDSYGRSVRKFILNELLPGKNNLDFDISGLPAGVYVCEMSLSTRGESHITTQKLILR